MAEVAELPDSYLPEGGRQPEPDGHDVEHRAYDSMTGEEQDAVDRYLAAIVHRMAEELADVATWHEGRRDERGRGWQKIIADVANRLGRLARAKWTPWDFADAFGALVEVVPMPMALDVPLRATWTAHRDRRDPAPFPTGLGSGRIEPLDAASAANSGRLAGSGGSDSHDAAPLHEVLNIVTASSVDVRRLRYLWEHRIPLGAVTLMPGEEGVGKTTLGVRIIADITRGALRGELYVDTPRDVLVIALEDGLEDVYVPRSMEAGADLDRVHIIRATYNAHGDERALIIPNDLGSIARAVGEFDAALVWVDCLVTTLPDAMKSISYKDTAKVMKSLGEMAENTGCAVVAPWHLNKQSGSDTALRIMDSRAFRTAVRSMLLVVPDPDAEEGVTQGIVALDKANAGTLHVPALRYRIQSSAYVVTDTDPRTGEVNDVIASCGVAEWIGVVEGNGRDIARAALMPAIDRAGTAKGCRALTSPKRVRQHGLT